MLWKVISTNEYALPWVHKNVLDVDEKIWFVYNTRYRNEAQTTQLSEKRWKNSSQQVQQLGGNLMVQTSKVPENLASPCDYLCPLCENLSSSSSMLRTAVLRPFPRKWGWYRYWGLKIIFKETPVDNGNYRVGCRLYSLDEDHLRCWSSARDLTSFHQHYEKLFYFQKSLKLFRIVRTPSVDHWLNIFSNAKTSLELLFKSLLQFPAVHQISKVQPSTF